ncbi:DUF3265 domain-containing protein [Vibrio cholerae]
MKCKLTHCLRVIRNSWHFHYPLVLVYKVGCGDLGLALLSTFMWR